MVKNTFFMIKNKIGYENISVEKKTKLRQFVTFPLKTKAIVRDICFTKGTRDYVQTSMVRSFPTYSNLINLKGSKLCLITYRLK